MDDQMTTPTATTSDITTAIRSGRALLAMAHWRPQEFTSEELLQLAQWCARMTEAVRPRTTPESAA